jgi:hypothetical protein
MTNLEDLEKILNNSGYTIEKKWRENPLIHNPSKHLVGYIKKEEGKPETNVVLYYCHSRVTQFGFDMNEGVLSVIEEGIKLRKLLDEEKIPYKENPPRQELAKKLEEYKKEFLNLAYKCREMANKIK